MKFIKYSLIAVIAVIIYSCGNDTPVSTNNEDPQTNYLKILTSENGTLKFEIWSATSNPLRFGYNKIGFKVFENNNPKSTGIVKFFPWKNHSIPTPLNSTPVSSQYNYVDSLSMFTGYSIFNEITASDLTWLATINYNDQLYSDTVTLTVNQYTPAQIIQILDMQSSNYYYLTLMKPYVPSQGLNTFQCMLHKTADDVTYEQVNDAQILIMPWMTSMGHGSPNNVHPVYTTDGIYEGTINLNMPGDWSVYDTVYHDNHKVTGNIPPEFKFNVQ